MITSSNKKKSVFFLFLQIEIIKMTDYGGKLGDNAIQMKSSKTRIKSIFLNKK